MYLDVVLCVIALTVSLKTCDSKDAFLPGKIPPIFFIFL